MVKRKISGITTLLLFTVFFSGSCSELFRGVNTELKPIRTEEDYQYFQYKIYVLDKSLMEKQGAEEEFIQWLEKSLAENGYPSPEYEILSRKPIKHTKEILFDAYDIYYEVKVKKQK